VSKRAPPRVIAFEEGATPVPVARPPKLARSVFHVASALLALALIRVLPGRVWLAATAGAFALAAWTMEIARRRSSRANTWLMRMFGPVAHDHERHRTNSSTWYVTALALLAAFAPLRGAELGVLVLGIADPAAGLVGRRFGRTRLRADRSLEGSLAFFVTGFGVSFAWLVATGDGASSAAWLAAIAGLTGAVTELAAGRRFDDNFVVPVSIAAVVGVWLTQR